jgi:ubiquinone/menaquinone biosynthesis C-methylase UbiE
VARYLIRGGDKGYDRLLVLARDRRADTLALLGRAGVGGGMRCVDVGCGGGAVTIDLAQLAAPQVAIGLDLDEVNLAHARQAAAERGVANIEFRAADVTAWDEPDDYDVVYSRFLLQHLADPVDLLRRMWSSVRTGGRLVVEDTDFRGWDADPPCAALRFFVDVYRATLERRGGDASSGLRLWTRFGEAGIPTPEPTVVQSARTGEAKALAWSTLDASADAIVGDGIATREEVEVALDELARFTRDPTTLIVGPRIYQYIARRPERSAT